MNRRKKSPESQDIKKVVQPLGFLEKENDHIRSKLENFFDCSSFHPDGKLGLPDGKIC